MPSSSVMGSIFKKAADGIDAVFGDEKHSHSHLDEVCDDLHPQSHTMNRFHSFAPPSSGNIKWFVDGCSYFWAVSEALERKSLCSVSVFILVRGSYQSLTRLCRGEREHLHTGLVA